MKLVKWLTQIKQKNRPTAKEILNSKHLPEGICHGEGIEKVIH
jgi:hypothetical protein